MVLNPFFFLNVIQIFRLRWKLLLVKHLCSVMQLNFLVNFITTKNRKLLVVCANTKTIFLVKLTSYPIIWQSLYGIKSDYVQTSRHDN